MEERIIKLINKVRLRLMFQRVVSCLLRTVAVGLLAALVVSLVSLVVPFYYAPHVECGVIVLAVLAGIVWGIVTAPDRRAAALAADGKGYQERLSTALELIEQEQRKHDTRLSVQKLSKSKAKKLQKSISSNEKSEAALNTDLKSDKDVSIDLGDVYPSVNKDPERKMTQIDTDRISDINPYKNLQLEDTWRAVQGFSVRKGFPLRVQLRYVAVWVVLAAALVASLFMDSLVRQRANELHALKVQAAETVAQVEEVEKALSESDGISESELAEYLEQLENSKSELNSASTSEELLKAQERLEQKLKSVAEETSDTTVAETAQDAASAANSLASDTRQSLLEQAQEALAQAQNGTDEEKENAYEKLSELASALGDDNLAQAADNYQSSNYSASSYMAAKSALAQAASDMSNSMLASGNSGSSDSSTSSDASVSGNSGSTGNGSNSNGSTGDSNNSDGSTGDGSNSDGSNSNGSTGDGSNGDGNSSNGSNSDGSNSNGSTGDGSTGNGSSGDGSNGNSSNGDGDGNGGSGGDGSGGGSSSGGSGTNSGNGSTGQGWNYGGDTGNEGNASSDESITVPDGEVGDDENLTGEATDSDSSSYASSDQAATWSGNKVSYGSVSAEYKEKAYAQVESSDYPDSLKEQIKSYFEELN